jgi:hypothetical protein
MPVIPEVAEPGVVMVGVFGPETKVHKPVPFTGVFPAKVAVVTLHKLWFDPAFEVVGVGEIRMDTLEVLGVQLPLEIVHWNT